MKDITQQWKALANKRKIKSEDIAALCIYRALVKNKGKEVAIAKLRKAFSPITNPIKLNNGAESYSALAYALRMVKYSQVLTWIDNEEDKNAIIAMSREISIRGKEIL